MDDPEQLILILALGEHSRTETAARSLRELAERDPDVLRRYSGKLLRAAMEAEDLRSRWNLIQVLGRIALAPRRRSVAVDWLFERLRDASPLTRVFALQALYDLSCGDEPLRRRWLPVARDFAATGTAAMRARARKLLQANEAWAQWLG